MNTCRGNQILQDQLPIQNSLCKLRCEWIVNTQVKIHNRHRPNCKFIRSTIIKNYFLTGLTEQNPPVGTVSHHQPRVDEPVKFVRIKLVAFRTKFQEWKLSPPAHRLLCYKEDDLLRAIQVANFDFTLVIIEGVYNKLIVKVIISSNVTKIIPIWEVKKVQYGRRWIAAKSDHSAN